MAMRGGVVLGRPTASRQRGGMQTKSSARKASEALSAKVGMPRSKPTNAPENVRRRRRSPGAYSLSGSYGY